MEVDLALIDHDDTLLNDVERYLTNTAKVHDVNAFSRLRSVPGIGTSLALVLLDEIPDLDRFPTVQDFAASARLVKWAKESAGQRHGSSGATIGNAHLTWACSEASVLFLRQNPPAQRALDQLASKPGKAKALSILAHTLGRAVSSRRKRREAFDMNTFLNAYAGRGRRSLTPHGSRHGKARLSPQPALWHRPPLWSSDESPAARRVDGIAVLLPFHLSRCR